MIGVHTHLQMDRTVGLWHLINPGAAGMPLDGLRNASYALIEGDADGWQATLRRVPFDDQVLWHAFQQCGFAEACGLSGQVVMEEFRTTR